MITVRLETQDGRDVGIVGKIPPFNEMLLWGERVFKYERTIQPGGAIDPDGVMIYRECFTVALVEWKEAPR